MSNQTELNTTVFHDYHVQAGGKMVEFAGYSMPVHYSQGIIEEHLYTRNSVGLFDVSHMGQLVVSGAGIAQGLEKLLPVDLDQLALNRQMYSTLTTEQGGILDDLIITRWGEDKFFIVVNAACKQSDINHFRQFLPNAEIDVLDRGLLALQGPLAIDVLRKLFPDVEQLVFLQGCLTSVEGIECYITRSGYTGEDGFEISVNRADCTQLVDLLLADANVRWVGLGARDSLRLEAGLCLYGHDIGLHTSPVEAGLLWSIGKSRRTGGTKQGGFLGEDTVLSHIEQGVDRKRVGFVVEGRAPVREGAEIIDDSGESIGVITSGGFSPSLQKPIAMGYIKTQFSLPQTDVNALVRGKPRKLTVTAMPLVPQRYCR
jgi:aminomethyltransferase